MTGLALRLLSLIHIDKTNLYYYIATTHYSSGVDCTVDNKPTELWKIGYTIALLENHQAERNNPGSIKKRSQYVTYSTYTEGIKALYDVLIDGYNCDIGKYALTCYNRGCPGGWGKIKKEDINRKYYYDFVNTIKILNEKAYF